MDFVAGCIGGCAGVLVGHPFDTVKVRIQTQNPLNPKYKGTFHCLSTTVRTESIAGLFRGMSSPMVGVSLINAVVFGVYGNAQRNFSDPESLKSHFYAGMAAGTIQSFISGPMELVKTRLQLQQTTSVPCTLQRSEFARAKYTGAIDCVRKLISNEGGIRVLTKGLGSTLIRDGPALAVYFASYEYLTRSALLLRDGSQELSTSALLMAGGLAGVVSWVVSYPIDVIKSRIQSDPISKGIRGTAKEMYAIGGGKAFLRGINSAIIRAYPTNAAIFFTVSLVYKLQEKYVAGKNVLKDVEGRLVEKVQQRVYYHLHYHHLGEKLLFHTISNHL